MFYASEILKQTSFQPWYFIIENSGNAHFGKKTLNIEEHLI